MTGPAVTFPLSAAESAAVVDAAVGFAAVAGPGRDGPYRALAAAAEADAVPAAQLPALERVCALALQTGKARQVGRAEAERALTAVFRRTPGGQALLAEVADVNRGLAQLAGRPLTAARLTWRAPGSYYLRLDAGGLELNLAVGPEGLSVQSVHTG